MAISNVIYVFDMDPPRRFGWSRGPDDPDTGERYDYPPLNQDGYTFHWRDQGTSPLADTVETMNQNVQSGLWRHFKVYSNQRAGTWFITDLARLTADIRTQAADLPAGQRNQMLNWANYLETDASVPRNGEPS